MKKIIQIIMVAAAIATIVGVAYQFIPKDTTPETEKTVTGDRNVNIDSSTLNGVSIQTGDITK